MLLWFLRQEFLSHPSPPLYSSPLLGADETQQQQQRASLVTPPPGYRLHLQVETKQSKTRCQLCQRILPASQFGPGASPHPVAFQHPNSSHDTLAGVYSGRGISLYVFSLHGRQRNSIAAFLSSTEQPNTTDSRDRQKTTSPLCLGQTLPLLVSAS